MAEISPMMQQYLEIKRNNPDKILFFRLGDFYEMFFDDAELVSRELELTLTSRASGNNERAPMCGVPFHSAEGYISRLIAKGYKIAICEQLEDPKLAKGLVKRDIVRVVTGGSATESELLDESKNNYLAAICMSGDDCALCFADVSTGMLKLTSFSGKGKEQGVVNELSAFSPTEVLLNTQASCSFKITDFIQTKLSCGVETPGDEYFDYDACFAECSNQFGAQRLEESGAASSVCGVCACGAVIRYLKYLYKSDTVNISDISVFSDFQFVRIPPATRRNLELTETMMNGGKKGSLLWVMDKTATGMGRRLLRSWLEKPLMNIVEITRRQNAVSMLLENNIALRDIHDGLKGVFDIERLTGRIVMGNANAKDLNALRQAAERIPAVKSALAGLDSQYLSRLYSQIDTLEDVCALIGSAISEDAPFVLRDGGIIKPGFNAELDELNDIQNGGRQALAEIEERERKRTGIPKLKIGFNKVFGYYIEVSNSYKAMVPDDYVRKQTLTGGERYITDELKKYENSVLGAKERSVRLEYELFSQIRNAVSQQRTRLQLTASALAQLDTLCSLAIAALENNYCCPVIVDRPVIDIKNGRHPVVEKVIKDSLFVPNDTYLDCGEFRTAIITGPNMSGKSTYMRQVALICIMAQIGSFVPAEYATLGIVDAIYTRVGAGDDLSAGQSTFMVEMSEVSAILKEATSKSLIILDEVGRGTSTFDGMSIAQSVLEYISDKKKLGAKALFSTHYHELTDLENRIEGVKNFNISVKKRGSSVIFLRKIVAGRAESSYGLEVARLAGLPPAVLARARLILEELESGSVPKAEPVRRTGDEFGLTASADSAIISQLKEIDTNTMSPLEALTTLNELVIAARHDGEM